MVSISQIHGKSDLILIKFALEVAKNKLEEALEELEDTLEKEKHARNGLEFKI